MDSGTDDPLRSAIVFTEDELALLLSGPAAPGREPGVFTVREIADALGWGIGRAGRRVYKLVDEGRATPVEVTVVKHNGVAQVTTGYRLLAGDLPARPATSLLEELTALLTRHRISEPAAAAALVLSILEDPA